MRLGRIIPLAICLLTMTACSGEKVQQTMDSAETGANDIEAAEEKEHADIYKRFLGNEEKVLMDCSGDVGKVFSLKNAEGKELTLSEVVRAVRDSCNAVDDDDIPEMVIDDPSYYQDVYTYKNGEVKFIFEGPCGTHGLTHEYSPRKGVFRSFWTEYAGKMYDWEYSSINENGEFVKECYLHGFNYDDLDGDGVPSEEEERLAQEGEVGGKIEYHSLLDKNIPESEVKAKIERYDSYAWDSMYGDWDYVNLISELAN